MRIKCSENRISILPESLLKIYGNTLVPLIINKTYVVYAMQKKQNITWFCILNEYSSLRWYPKYFFEISDPRLSKYWIFNFWNESENTKHFILGFPEWANNEYFFTDLMESDEEAWTIFRAYEKLMNVEFPDPTIIERAEIGDEKWLICPLCIDAWLSDAQDALVECPKCKTLMNNPRYKNELLSYKTE